MHFADTFFLHSSFGQAFTICEAFAKHKRKHIRQIAEHFKEGQGSCNIDSVHWTHELLSTKYFMVTNVYTMTIGQQPAVWSRHFDPYLGLA